MYFLKKAIKYIFIDRPIRPNLGTFDHASCKVSAHF